MNTEKLKNKLHTAFQLSGFLVRSEFCAFIIEKFIGKDIPLENNNTFDTYVKSLCTSLKKQCLLDKSIKKEHIEHAIEVCLHEECDKNETIFNVINAFDFPKLYYDPDRMIYYLPATSESKVSGRNSITQLFKERYSIILERTQRNFKNKITEQEENRLSLQTVDYLLTLSYTTLDKILVLGSLLKSSAGKYYLEDPSGMVQLDLTHAKYQEGFFTTGSFVLVNGYVADKILQVSTVILPPGEEYVDSRPTFGNINYFGGPSLTPLRDSLNLQEQLARNEHSYFLFLSDVWLDHPLVFEKLKILFNIMQHSPPVAFVFMGNFMQEPQDVANIVTLKKLFKQFGELINNYPNLINNSQFVFVPGMSDQSTPHIAPRIPLPKYITEGFSKFVSNAIFATNPCRLQYCSKEIIIFRADVLFELMQGTLHKPKNEADISEYVARTIISQGHLSLNTSLDSLRVHWDFDYALRLYRLPDLIVLGDKSEAYKRKYKGCQVLNPGSFCKGGFQFTAYTPFTGVLEECDLTD